MGKRGPRPTPREILKLRGSKLAASRPAEPEQPAGAPVKPDWISKQPIASAKWDETLLVLREMGCESPAYGDFLAMYCQAHQDLHDAMRVIAESGPIVESERGGGRYQHPAVGMKHKAIDRIAKFGREFGLSPGSIRDVQKTNQKDKPTEKRKKFFGAG